MKYFITGSTGYIGNELTKKLLTCSYPVHLLVRSEAKAASLQHSLVKVFTGNITDYGAVERAMAGCSNVFHLAALAKSGEKRRASFDEINIGGTGNVLKAALTLGVKWVVFTSSAGVLKLSGELESILEESGYSEKYFEDFIRTKATADRLCAEYVKKGLDIVIVLPSRFMVRESSAKVMR